MTDAAFDQRSQTPAAPAAEAEFRDYVLLLKPRVMSLVVFTALIGLVVAPAPVHPVIAVAAILCIAVGAGASGALNMWVDADVDAVMKRTAGRPIPAGRVQRGEALAIGLALSVLSVMMLGLFANPLAAAILAFTIFFYAVIYSMWLKRATPQNIVIGGAAGAFPPMIGWAVATGGVSVESVLLFGLIFMWTPPHFWAMALFVKPDYARAGIPMMPVAEGAEETRRQILLYSLALVPVALAPAVTQIGGPIYLLTAVVLNARFLQLAWRVSRRGEAEVAADRFATEKAMFRLSILYLFAHFAALGLEAAARGLVPGWPQWILI